MDHHPRAVEIRNLKMGPFLKSQTAGVDRRETGAIGRKPEKLENSANLIRAQDGWKLLLAMGTDKVGSLGFAGETPISGGLGARLKLWQAEVE
jgi:hypothetical protein